MRSVTGPSIASSARSRARRSGPPRSGPSEGIVRLEARPGAPGSGQARLYGSTRGLGDHSGRARIGIASQVHPGPAAAPGAKIPRPEIDAGRLERDARGLDEILFLDAEGFVVEGSRTNVVAHLAGGDWATPPRARGGVFGVALGLALERLPAIRERDLRRTDLESAREIALTNGARGAFPAVSLEGSPVGRPDPAGYGPMLSALCDALSD